MVQGGGIAAWSSDYPIFLRFWLYFLFCLHDWKELLALKNCLWRFMLHYHLGSLSKVIGWSIISKGSLRIIQAAIDIYYAHQILFFWPLLMTCESMYECCGGDCLEVIGTCRSQCQIEVRGHGQFARIWTSALLDSLLIPASSCCKSREATDTSTYIDSRTVRDTQCHNYNHILKLHLSLPIFLRKWSTASSPSSPINQHSHT